MLIGLRSIAWSV